MSTPTELPELHASDILGAADQKLEGNPVVLDRTPNLGTDGASYVVPIQRDLGLQQKSGPLSVAERAWLAPILGRLQKDLRKQPTSPSPSRARRGASFGRGRRNAASGPHLNVLARSSLLNLKPGRPGWGVEFLRLLRNNPALAQMVRADSTKKIAEMQQRVLRSATLRKPRQANAYAALKNDVITYRGESANRLEKMAGVPAEELAPTAGREPSPDDVIWRVHEKRKGPRNSGKAAELNEQLLAANRPQPTSGARPEVEVYTPH